MAGSKLLPRRRLVFIVVAMVCITAFSKMYGGHKDRSQQSQHSKFRSSDAAKAHVFHDVDADRNDNGIVAAVDISLQLIDAHKIQKYEPVPGLTDLTFFVWDTDPKPILMLKNTHLKWYEEVPNHKLLVDLIRHLFTAPNARGTVIEMGMNDGYISALASSYGFPVIAVDAQPECVRRFRIAAAVNGWTQARIYNKLMIDEDVTLDVPNGRCTGGSRFQDGVKLLGDRGAHSDITGVTKVKSARLDDLVGSNEVLLFYLDVEGAELSVLRSAKKMLSEKRMKNLVFEFAPHRWNSTAAASRAEVISLFSSGYACRHLDVALSAVARADDGAPVIKDWGRTFDEVAAKRGIVDIWCRAI